MNKHKQITVENLMCKLESVNGTLETVVREAYNKGHQHGWLEGRNCKDYYYNKGLNDAWEILKTIRKSFNDSEIEEIFYPGKKYVNPLLGVIDGNSPRDAILKYQGYEGKFTLQDAALSDFCGAQESCESCLMKQAFPQCGRGWHVFMTTGNENLAAHRIMDAANLIKGKKT